VTINEVIQVKLGACGPQSARRIVVENKKVEYYKIAMIP
jgi:hypothetical protein